MIRPRTRSGLRSTLNLKHQESSHSTNDSNTNSNAFSIDAENQINDVPIQISDPEPYEIKKYNKKAEEKGVNRSRNPRKYTYQETINNGFGHLENITQACFTEKKNQRRLSANLDQI